MPVFLCRWPNGDCSLVLARNKTDAVERLDEVANAEDCPMVQLTAAQVHFTLTDDGQLALDGLGDDTEEEIFAFRYPALQEAFAAGTDVTRAVRQERERSDAEQAPLSAPATELGRRAKAQLDMATTIINRKVAKAARLHLRSFKARGKPS